MNRPSSNAPLALATLAALAACESSQDQQLKLGMMQAQQGPDTLVAQPSIFDVENDPEIRVLHQAFNRVAAHQRAAVVRAGGYCALPKKSDRSNASEECNASKTWCPDKRLGDELHDLVAQRNALLRRKFSTLPEEHYPSWRVDLGRTICEPESRPYLREGIIKDPVKRRMVEARLDALRNSFNRICVLQTASYPEDALQREEKAENPLDYDPLAVRRLLLMRGRAIASGLTSAQQYVLMKKMAMALYSGRCSFKTAHPPRVE